MQKNSPTQNTSDASAAITQSLEDGSYFAQSLNWYKTVFVAPIGQRSWMLVFAITAIISAFASLLALDGLLPVTNRPAIPATQERIWDYVIAGTRIRQSGEGRDEAILRFFVSEYVKRRETYNRNRFDDFQRFVEKHSTEEVYNQYTSVFGKQNPRSLYNALGKSGRRSIEIEDIRVKFSSASAEARVIFKASFFANADLPSSKWRVRLRGFYRPMIVREQLDVIDADVKLDIKPASFKVSEYELEKIS